MEFLLLALALVAITAWWVAAVLRERRGGESAHHGWRRAAPPEPASDSPPAPASSGGGPEIRWKMRPQAQGFSVPYGIVEEVNQSLRRVPPISQGMIRILRELGSDESSAQSVGEILADEPVLTAALLRMANSSATGLRREILTVPEAVTYLGFSTTKSLLLRLHLGTLIPAATPGVGYDATSLWLHAMAVAHVAEELARLAGADPNLALTAGLLHDIGKIALNAQFPQRMAELLCAAPASATGMLDRERQSFGADHAVFGGRLASQWSLPASLTDIIHLHHTTAALPEMLAPETRRTLLCVHVANQLVKQCHAYCDCVELDPVAPLVTNELGFPSNSHRLLDQRMQGIIHRVFHLNGLPAAPPAPASKAA